jgi:hypothetical protein
MGHTIGRLGAPVLAYPQASKSPPLVSAAQARKAAHSI